MRWPRFIITVFDAMRRDMIICSRSRQTCAAFRRKAAISRKAAAYSRP